MRCHHPSGHHILHVRGRGATHSPCHLFFFSSFYYFDLYLHNLLKLYTNFSILKKNYITLLNPLNNDLFNVFCYADTLILTSLSVTGLEEQIDTASSYIIAHDLNFNETKTICPYLGAIHFETTPEWHLNGSVLREEAAVTYRGTVLSSNPKLHFDTRIKSAIRAFYGLQCAGLCGGGGVAPTVFTNMFKVAIQPILTYGCATLNFTRSSVTELDKMQAKSTENLLLTCLSFLIIHLYYKH